MPHYFQYHKPLGPATFFVMQLVLFRHAERLHDTTNNPPLSPRGEKQANHLHKLVTEHKLETPQKLVASPKLRAQQTLQPLAESLQQEPFIWMDLDEKATSESSAQFHLRVRRTLEQLATVTGPVFVCTHVDWIEVALVLMNCDCNLNQSQYMNWPPGHYMVFEIQNGCWHLIQQGDLIC